LREVKRWTESMVTNRDLQWLGGGVQWRNEDGFSFPSREIESNTFPVRDANPLFLLERKLAVRNQDKVSCFISDLQHARYESGHCCRVSL
jgi:hypothetical protein